jgi:hypothetical protein
MNRQANGEDVLFDGGHGSIPCLVGAESVRRFQYCLDRHVFAEIQDIFDGSIGVNGCAVKDKRVLRKSRIGS